MMLLVVPCVNLLSLQENNRSEVERLDKERRADFINMMKGFVVNQVHCYFMHRVSIRWMKPFLIVQ